MDNVLHFLLGNAIVATVLAMLAAFSTWKLRRPALSHALWALVLLKLITPAFLQVPIPGLGNYPAANTAENALAQERPLDTVGGVRTSEARTSLSSSVNSVEEPTEHLTAAVSTGASRGISREMPFWARTIFWIECLGGLAWFSWVGLRIRRFHGLLSQADLAPAALVREVERLAARIGLRRCPEVLLWRKIAPPMVWFAGWRARLILPQDFVGHLNDQQLAAVLTHELAHLRRGDHWVRFLEVVATGLYWWHPVLWWARRELERTEEQACDAWVLWLSPQGGESYAGVLLKTVDFVSGLRTSSCPLASGLGRLTFLKRRLTMVIEGNVPRVVSVWGRLALLILAVTLLPLTPVGAASAPSLEELKTGLKERREKIKSLYVEVVGEQSSPLIKEELDRLPKDDAVRLFASGPKMEFHYAAKGEKRYSHWLQTGKKGLYDRTWVYNGDFIWARDRQPGEPKGAIRLLSVWTPKPRSGDLRFIYPNEWRALTVGEALIGPNLAAMHSWEDLFYLDFTNEKRERWTFSAADATEEVEGDNCAVLNGTIHVSYQSKKGEEKQFVRHVKCWLDLQHGMALRKWEEYREPGKELMRVVNSHFEQIKPGIWLPHEITLQTIAPTGDSVYPEQYRGKPVLETKIKVTKCEINQVADRLFEPILQPGEKFVDSRNGPAKVRNSLDQ